MIRLFLLQLLILKTLPLLLHIQQFSSSGAYPTPDQVLLSGDTPTVTIDPLTGLPPADPSLLQRRPLAIKVANYPRVFRPQAGLTLA